MSIDHYDKEWQRRGTGKRKREGMSAKGPLRNWEIRDIPFDR